MAYKLLDGAQERWRRVDGPELVALVRASAALIDGQLVERDDTPHEEDDQDCHDEERAAWPEFDSSGVGLGTDGLLPPRKRQIWSERPVSA